MKKKRVKSGLMVLLAIGVSIIVLRFFFLPHWVSQQIQQKVKTISDYDVTYRDFEISLISGSYSLKDIVLTKRDSKLPLPFFQADQISMHLEPASLLSDQWLSQVNVDHPIINFIHGPDDVSSQTKISSEWINIIKDLASLPVNSIRIHNGEINYNDFHSVPKVLLSMTDITLKAENLYSNQDEKLMSGKVDGSGRVADGSISVKMELNAFYERPMFNLSAELVNLNLSDLDNFLEAYGNIQVQQGIFSLYAEASTKNNKVVGYFRPVIEDISVTSLGDAKRSLNLIRPSSNSEEHVWVVTADVSGNWNEIKFENNLNDPDMTIWSAAGTTLHKAFVEALVTSLERSVQFPESHVPKITPKTETPANLSNAQPKKKESFLKRIFKKKEDKKKE